MAARSKYIILLLLLLAVFAGRPAEHCEAAEAQPHCSTPACKHTEAPSFELERPHRHMPCIHLNEGDTLLTRVPVTQLSAADLPPMERRHFRTLRPMAAAARPCAPRFPLPPGIMLPMLC